VSPAGKTAPPAPKWRNDRARKDRGRTWKRVGITLAAGFALGFLVVAIAFFPGFGRSAIVTVPDLRGKSLAQATRLAERSGLQVVKGSELPNPSVPPNSVLAQEPLPGQETTRGASVLLILSTGAERRAIPDLSGLGPDAAADLLRRYGFTVKVTRVVNPAYEGKVLQVKPAVGTRVPVPSTVELVLSAGPPKILAPDVLHLPLPEAEAKLTAAGLRLGTVEYDPLSAEALGGIASQRPAAGDSIRQGGAVHVVVSGTAPAEPAVPDSLAPPPDTEAPAQTPPAEEPPRRR
jgi:beta-lactam-binding protein with PASTA domain